MEHTRQQHDARRKKTRYLPQKKAGLQKGRHKFVKKMNMFGNNQMQR